MTPLDRLLQEAIPVRPAPRPHQPRHTEPAYQWTTAEQDQHWHDLCQSVGATNETRPHLHLAQPAA